MKKILKSSLLLLSILLVITTAACETLEEAGLVQGEDKGLRASGTIEAVDVSVSSETGGTVVQVYASEGERVQAGDMLFRLKDDVLEAQKNQAEAAYESAKAGMALAESALESARIHVEMTELQYEIALETARQQERALLGERWRAAQPAEFELPVWYFERSEAIGSALLEVEAAAEGLEEEHENLRLLHADSAYAELEKAEVRLSDAQAAYLVADAVLEQAKRQTDRDIREIAQQNFDTAEAELEAAQTSYDQLLTESDVQNVLEARARLAVAEERYQTALDRYHGLLTGEFALAVQLAAAAVEQAEAAVIQANAGVTQAQNAINEAQAALDLIEVYFEKLSVNSPVDGVVRTRGIEPGEVLQPGVTAMTIDQTDDLTLTIYFPENQYGKISLGDMAEVRVDSFPGEVFEGVVIRIADRAEYTPRNVQTQEERVTTVYAVELSLSSPAGKLKPGMPADATFE